MKFKCTKFFRHLNISVALILGGLFAACLDIPSEPNLSNKIESIKVHVVQYGKVDSTTLKINPRDSSALVASVTPISVEDELKYYWFYEGDILDSGRVFPVTFKNHIFVPHALYVVDKEGNSRTIKFSTILNSAPILEDITLPAQGETVDATPNSPILFQWVSTDSKNEILTHILEIDSIQYNVGTLTRVFQSGFNPGEHQFRVIVTDPYGDSDTLSWVKFKVRNPYAEES